MPSKYFVGGSGNSSDTAHWSLTSGGAGGAAVPDSTDDVFLDTLSHTTDYTFTIDTTFTCRSFTASAPASGNVTRAGTAAFSCHGSLTLYSAMVNSYTGTTTFRATTTGFAITTAGLTIGGAWVFNGIGGGWTLTDALMNTGASLTLSAGALDTGGYTVTASVISSNLSSTDTRSLTLRGSTVNVMAGTAWQFSNTTGVTLDAGSSTIMVTRTDGTAIAFTGGGLTYNNVIFTGDNLRISGGNNTFYNLGVLTAGYATGMRIVAGSTQTIRGAFYTNGFAANLAKISSLTNASPYTLAKTNGMVSVDYMSIRDCTTSGGNGWYAGANSTNVSGNTGWTFTAPPQWTGITSVSGVPQASLSSVIAISKIKTGSFNGVAT